jgi:hypothetical protein
MPTQSVIIGPDGIMRFQRGLGRRLNSLTVINTGNASFNVRLNINGAPIPVVAGNSIAFEEDSCREVYEVYLTEGTAGQTAIFIWSEATLIEQYLPH